MNEIWRRRPRLAIHSRIVCLTTLGVGREGLRPHYESALFASTALRNGGTWHHNISLSLISERAEK